MKADHPRSSYGSQYSVELTLAPDNQPSCSRICGADFFGQSQTWNRLSETDPE